jgi:hypothetical protein
MSLSARLLNVFAIPGDVFEDVKSAPPSTGNWLVPIMIAAVVGILSVVVIFSQPAILQQVKEQQAKMFDGMVKAGKMSQADADRAIATAQKFSGPTLLKVSGSFGAIIASFAQVFGWAFLLWLLGLFLLKARFSYLKALEVAGLAVMISVLGSIVTLLLTVSLGKVTAPTLALLLSQVDVKNPFHQFLARTNVFTVWLLAVMASGLARLAGARFSPALFGVLSCWLVMQMFLIFVVAGLVGLMKFH